MANPALTRWVMASVAKYFSDTGTAASIPTLVDGLETHTEEFVSQSERAEIRVNGPYTKRMPGCENARVTINILCSSVMGESGKNVYGLDTTLGVFHAAADDDIPVFKYGSEVGDDSTQIGCLKLLSGKNDYVRVIKFGQLEENTRLRQGMVSATYELDVTGV